MDRGPEKHLTLVGMSGVRIYDPELRAMGMTLPGFIERGKVIASLPNLGLLTLAGLTPSDWDILYIEVDELNEDSIDSIVHRAKGLVAISSLTARVEDAYRLSARLRENGIQVILGGLHASTMPDEAEQYTDSVVVGQGEDCWSQVLSDYQSGQLQRRYVSGRSPEFEPYAVPRFDLLDPNRYNRITVQTTRGCPLDCSFCGASRLISPYKRKSIERVRTELKAIAKIWPRPFIELADDNTFVHKPWSIKLVKTIGEFGAKWFTETDISVADNEELLCEMARSGCAQILVGLEAIDAESLSEADTKSWKKKRLSKYRDSIQRIQDRGISVNGCFAFGFDNQSPEVFESTARFIEDSGLSEVQLTILTPFPGTALFAKLQREKRLFSSRFWDKCTLFDLVFEPKRMTSAELRQGFYDLAREVYSRKSTEQRKTRFRTCVREARRIG